MSKAKEMYDGGYGCSCHISPPCSFCDAMNEAEVDAYVGGGMTGLTALWNTSNKQTYCDKPMIVREWDGSLWLELTELQAELLRDGNAMLLTDLIGPS